jgi:hypothetical protein
MNFYYLLKFLFILIISVYAYNITNYRNFGFANGVLVEQKFNSLYV